jgi:SsrA-binding protein
MVYAENKKARHDYTALETFEAGIVLSGQETKSVREGTAKLQGAYLVIRAGEVWLLGCHIPVYSKAGKVEGFDPTRTRKVLLKSQEITHLIGKIQQKGLTLVPFSLYPRGHRVKLSFGLCRGKKAHDKRETLKARDLDRSLRRVQRGGDE